MCRRRSRITATVRLSSAICRRPCMVFGSPIITLLRAGRIGWVPSEAIPPDCILERSVDDRVDVTVRRSRLGRDRAGVAVDELHRSSEASVSSAMCSASANSVRNCSAVAASVTPCERSSVARSTTSDE